MLPALPCQQHQDPGGRAQHADATGRTHAGAFCGGMLRSLSLPSSFGDAFFPGGSTTMINKFEITDLHMLHS